MSPFIGLLVLAALIGCIAFFAGCIMRHRRLILIAAPAPILLGVWIWLASVPPNAMEAYDVLFGGATRQAARQIHTIKPTLMDGFFISFQISPDDFSTWIRPELEDTEIPFGHSFARGQRLPRQWPDWLDTTTNVFRKERVVPAIDYGPGWRDLLLIYDAEHGIAYGSVLWESW